MEFSILGPLEKVLAAGGMPSYPISRRVYTTLDKTITPLPHGPKVLTPRQVSEYKPNHYGEWDGNGPGFPYLRPEMRVTDTLSHQSPIHRPRRFCRSLP